MENLILLFFVFACVSEFVVAVKMCVCVYVHFDKMIDSCIKCKCM